MYMKVQTDHSHMTLKFSLHSEVARSPVLLGPGSWMTAPHLLPKAGRISESRTKTGVAVKRTKFLDPLGVDSKFLSQAGEDWKLLILWLPAIHA